ncbi:MAG: ATP-grasp domain-containing protein [Planctomycetales bacterium]
MNNDDRVLILGGSARAAAESARRAGMSPICADIFADLDLRAAAELVLPVEDLHDDLVRAAREAPPCPFLYTGALENRPDVVGAIAAARPLWGNGPDVLAVVRDPFRLKEILQAARLPALGLRSDDDPPPDDDGREWVWKPHDGAAGRGIRRLSDKYDPEEHLHEPGYFQEFATGAPISAVYVAGREGTRFVGTSRQLVGIEALGASRFGYCGSIGPLELPPEIAETVRRIGEAVAGGCGLRGVFGCDFILDGGRPLLVEVNPRYPASLEVFERARGEALLAAHRAAFAVGEQRSEVSGQRSEVADRSSEVGESGSRPVSRFHPPPAPSRKGKGVRSRVIGKAVLYAHRAVDVPDLSCFPMARTVWELPFVADRPAAGTHVPKGHPICTVLAEGSSEEECAAQLAERGAAVQRHIFGKNAGDDENIRLDASVLLDPKISCR